MIKKEMVRQIAEGKALTKEREKEAVVQAFEELKNELKKKKQTLEVNKDGLNITFE